MTKNVRFLPQPSIHNIVVWKFAYTESQKKYWEFVAADRFKFAQRIANIQKIITPILQNKLKCKD